MIHGHNMSQWVKTTDLCFKTDSKSVIFSDGSYYVDHWYCTSARSRLYSTSTNIIPNLGSFCKILKSTTPFQSEPQCGDAQGEHVRIKYPHWPLFTVNTEAYQLPSKALEVLWYCSFSGISSFFYFKYSGSFSIRPSNCRYMSKKKKKEWWKNSHNLPSEISHQSTT